MTTPFFAIAAIVALGLFYVVLPVMLDAFRRFRYRQVVKCPNTHGMAEVQLNAGLATLTAAFGKPELRVQSCTLWPDKKGCAEACVKENWPAD